MKSSGPKSPTINWIKERNPKLTALVDRLRRHPLWRLESALITGGIILGLLSGMINNVNQARKDEQLRDLFQSTEVLVLNKDVRIGDILDSNMTRPELMLLRNITANTVKPAKLNLVLGHRFSMALKAGDPVLLTSLQGINDSTDLASKIPAGKRFFTLTIADTAASRGFIKPNDHVDVMAHLSLPNRGMTTFLVLQDVTLVSVGSSTILDHKGRSTGSDVSFYVDAKDIEMLSFAQKRGEFSLSLRNPMDSTKKQLSKGIDLNDFLDHESIANASGGGELSVTSNGKTLEKQK